MCLLAWSSHCVVMVVMAVETGASHRHASSGTTVGFVGLGNMGGHMARNLIKKGHPLIVYDVTSASMEALKNDGLW